ncbi:MAG TPA: metalloregulator ArsR/SmtB family transcription factor [Thermotogota bacterium]|mgnify:CR=1 FL=1|nr:metalloregulator ArsR/SmtB family transcription factor [Thermotogota bacterium]HRW35080.1 metalloregulator ArsR/SmtB family transcription factor [Thermotogota bacterium]
MLEEQFKALADGNRLRIINLLLNGEYCVCELEVFLGLTQSNLSRHLGKLKSSGIIDAKKDGQWVYYTISEDLKMGNPLLHQHLQTKLREDPLYQKDVERMDNYKKNRLTCSLIRENKEQVIQIIDPECSCGK